MGPLDKQMAILADRFAGAAHHSMPSGAGLVTVPGIRLPEGWSKQETAVHFVVPPGYPYATLDCFWADAQLRLANGALPASSGPQALPHLGTPALWFSWHLSAWRPSHDSLTTYARFTSRRFQDVR